MEKIEFIIPCYNNKYQLKNILYSLLNQSNPNWIAHVISDGEWVEYDDFKIDFENQTRLLLGGPLRATTKVKQIFSSVFRKTPRIIKTDAKTAELVKYVTNAFLSTKVSFANEMYQLCEGLDLDYDKIIEYATLDPRLGDSHWGVPGPDGDFGFGGHCFPKDLSALIEITKQLNTVNNVLKAVQTTNNTVRSNRDWEKMKGRAIV